jgi:hypothetical protein
VYLLICFYFNGKGNISDKDDEVGNLNSFSIVDFVSSREESLWIERKKLFFDNNLFSLSKNKKGGIINRYIQSDTKHEDNLNLVSSSSTSLSFETDLEKTKNKNSIEKINSSPSKVMRDEKGDESKKVKQKNIKKNKNYNAEVKKDKDFSDFPSSGTLFSTPLFDCSLNLDNPVNRKAIYYLCSLSVGSDLSEGDTKNEKGISLLLSIIPSDLIISLLHARLLFLMNLYAYFSFPFSGGSSDICFSASSGVLSASRSCLPSYGSTPFLLEGKNAKFIYFFFF